MSKEIASGLKNKSRVREHKSFILPVGVLLSTIPHFFFAKSTAKANYVTGSIINLKYKPRA